MKVRMQRNRLFWALILLSFFPFCNLVFGQQPLLPDSLPRIVAGKFDWEAYKQKINATRFQQNDLSIYVLRKNNLSEMISKEENADWIMDWHFFDVNHDRYLDAFYSGATKVRGGYHSYIMLADTGLSYPIIFDAPGYVNDFRPDKEGINLILREDAHGKGYLHKISSYRIDFKSDTAFCLWQLQLVSTTEIPVLGLPEAVQIQQPSQLRTSPQLLNAPAADLDQDGKPDVAGNVIAALEPLTPCFKLAEFKADDFDWSFVLVLNTPKNNHVFQPVKGLRMAYGGWVLTQALQK